MATNCADKAKPLGKALSNKASSMAKVQGGGYGGGRGSDDSMTNSASGKSRRLALKALAEDEAHQH